MKVEKEEKKTPDESGKAIDASEINEEASENEADILRRKIEEIFSSGAVYSVTGDVISSVEEYEGYIASLGEAAARTEAEREAKEAAAAFAKEKIAAEIADISAIDPEVVSSEALFEHQSFGRVVELIEKGLGVADAFKLANIDKLIERAEKAGERRALNRTASKAHLLKSGSFGGDIGSVPAVIAARYKDLLPGISDSEIAAHYGKYKKSV